MIMGGCFCGHVRYELDGESFDATICHCVDCRRVAASPMVAWFSVARSSLRFTTAEPKRFQSSAKAVRGFCPNCGTPLTFEAGDTPETIDIMTVSLDAPDAMPPRDHVWVRQRLPWVRLDDDLPAYPENRPVLTP